MDEPQHKQLSALCMTMHAPGGKATTPCTTKLTIMVNARKVVTLLRHVSLQLVNASLQLLAMLAVTLSLLLTSGLLQLMEILRSACLLHPDRGHNS